MIEAIFTGTDIRDVDYTMANNALLSVDKCGINRGAQVSGRRYSLGLHAVY
jgi:hypothetical protein